jgi:drug/metabolite transporter (DMT)-like permease
MIKLIGLMTLQSFFLVLSQIFLKFGLSKIELTKLSFKTLKVLVFAPMLWLCFFSMGIAGVIWFYVIKNFKLSIAYPMVSISYIFMLIAADLILKEPISIIRWLGVLVIIFGIFLITRQ